MTFTDSSAVPNDERSGLRANCADCFALCCTAFGFQRSADFPIDKPAGTPCANLTDDFSCSIHDSLRPRGFRGCTVFDCFGAGQSVSQNLFGGRSWKERPDTSAEMFRAFGAEIRHTLDCTTAEVLATDVERIRAEVRQTLIEVSEEARGGYAAAEAGRSGLHPSADLVGSDLRSLRLCGARLDGADLSNALFLTQLQVDAA